MSCITWLKLLGKEQSQMLIIEGTAEQAAGSRGCYIPSCGGGLLAQRVVQIRAFEDKYPHYKRDRHINNRSAQVCWPLLPGLRSVQFAWLRLPALLTQLTLVLSVSAVHAQLWSRLQAPSGPVQERRERRHSAGIQVPQTQSAHVEGTLQPEALPPASVGHRSMGRGEMSVFYTSRAHF